jgi:hypothetical protein
MHTIFEPARAGVVTPDRLLLLPAACTGPDDFVRAGFVRAVRERAIALDLVLVDVDVPHLADRAILRELRNELVLPARALGCQSIWICGLSLGGFVAVSFAERYADEIDGLCLLAPYLGNRIITREIEQASGVAAWEPGELAEDDDVRRIWRFIKTRRAHPVPLHLGFGRDDRFAESHRLMAAALPPESVDVVSGGHDWPTWRKLWENFLDVRFTMQCQQECNRRHQ